jgi:hypothetical protein
VMMAEVLCLFTNYLVLYVHIVLFNLLFSNTVINFINMRALIAHSLLHINL